MKKYITLLLLGSSLHAVSQNLDVKLPTVIPPSPEAASLGKYGDIPVGYYTGVPNISIPIHTIQVRDISVPVQLSYHASGVKVEEEASWVGLGWSLMAGGVITRSVRGNDDFRTTSIRKSGYVYSSEFDEQFNLNINEARELCFGARDGQPDIFYYNFSGYSGKFFLKKKEPGHFDEPVEVVLLSNSEKIKIDYDEQAKTWTVLTKDGTAYTFGTKEYVKSFGGPIDNPLASDGNIMTSMWDDTDAEVISSWYLDRIKSPLDEEVNFTYDVDESGRSPYVSKSVIGRTDTRTEFVGVGNISRPNKESPYELENGADYCNMAIQTWEGGIFNWNGLKEQVVAGCGPDGSYSGSVSFTNHVYLRSIEYKNGKVEFHTSEREDLQWYEQPGNLKPRKLDRIDVKSSGSEKLFLFEYTYFNDHKNGEEAYLYKRLKLDKLTEVSGRARKNSYVFEYEGDNGFTHSPLPAKDSFGRDHWGFANGAEGNKSAGRAAKPSLVPGYSYLSCGKDFVRIEGADREPNEVKAKMGILKRIKYPTGGFTSFEYEMHDYTINEVDFKEHKFFDVVPGNGSKTFEISDTTVLEINAQIKCNTLSCFSTGTDQVVACTESQLFPHLSKPYLRITHNGDPFHTFLYGDYYCKLDSKFCATQDVDGINLCGTQKNKTFTLYPGTYTIEALNVEGFSAEANYTYYQYEVFDAGESVKKGGGFRVKKVTDHDGIDVANDVVKSFRYTASDEETARTSGKIMTVPRYVYPLASFVEYQGGSNAYVCLYIRGFSYSNRPLGTSAQGSPVGYDRVTISYGENGENGRSVYEYQNDPDEENSAPYGNNNLVIPNVPTITHSVSNGQLLRETHFTKDNFKVREVRNDYDSLIEDSNRLEAVAFFSAAGCDSDIAWFHYYEPSEWWFMASSTEKVFDTSDPSNERYFSKRTDYRYNPEHKQVTEIETKHSDGFSRLRRIFYPLDLKLQVPREMYLENQVGFRHMHSQVIRQEEFELTGGEEVFLHGIRNNYEYDNSKGLVLLQWVEKAREDGTYEQRLFFEQYDEKGNFTEILRSDDAPIAYIWGYDKTLPIAEIINARREQVFYTSFEEDGNDSRAKAGRKSHAGDYSFSPPEGFTPVPSGILSYWYWADSKWNYRELSYSGGPVTITDGEYIDELRIYPANAQMTTYCYDPGVGIITATDIRGQSTYYEYDGLNRLVFLKDLNRDILKYYDYQYKTTNLEE